MAVLLFLYLSLALGGLFAFHTYRSFRRNLESAKRSGLAYVCVPTDVFWVPWLVTHKIWLPLLNLLPSAWTCSWLPFLDPEWAYKCGFHPFAEQGEVFLIVSPSKIYAWVADPGACINITLRRTDFIKPVEIYSSLDIYGKNVVSSEGAVWRQHRKVTAPSFNEKNNELVFHETISQGQTMIRHWFGQPDRAAPSTDSSPRIENPSMDAMTFALHIISRAGFGVPMSWPGAAASQDEKMVQSGMGDQVPKGHSMTYHEAITELLGGIFWIPAFPRWFLRLGPLKALQKVDMAATEWGKYMNQLLSEKKREIIEGQSESGSGMDLLGSLMKGSGLTPGSTQAKTTGQAQFLSESEVLGNAFVFMLAGHETTANVIHHGLLLLAMNPASQRRAQQDIDQAIGHKPMHRWNYEADYPIIANSMAAAVANESLRLIPPATGIPKCTKQPQPLTLSNGRRAIIPANAGVVLNTPALHKHPRSWPCAPDFNPSASSSDGNDDDLDLFRPERWLVDPNASPTGDHEAVSDGEDGPPPAPNASRIYKPPRGAFVPFSEGYRSCLGKRFAQVEINTVFAVLLRDYSIELAIDDFASDAQLATMSDAQRRTAWDAARAHASDLLRNKMGSVITLQLRDCSIPLRIVKRGTERFWWKDDIPF